MQACKDTKKWNLEWGRRIHVVRCPFSSNVLQLCCHVCPFMQYIFSVRGHSSSYCRVMLRKKMHCRMNITTSTDEAILTCRHKNEYFDTQISIKYHMQVINTALRISTISHTTSFIQKRLRIKYRQESNL